MNRDGFTLAEVLITLGIIGVVAALTLPSLIQKYQEKALVTSYLRVYSILNQAYNFAVQEYGTYDTWEKSGVDDYNKIRPYLKLSADCPQGIRNDACFPNTTYKTLNPNVTTDNWSMYNKPSVRLTSGESILFLSDAAVTFIVDLNGNSKPNKLGVDCHFFSFYLEDMTAREYKPIIKPGGDWINSTYGKYCSYTGTWYPGNSCGFWILKYKNMDYLHMSDDEIKKRW